MARGPEARLAVLIDADNTSAKVAEGLFAEIAKLGEASVRRIYGDFADARMKGWIEAMPRHAIIAHQNFAYTSGKNSADIALVIDAMDLLHTGRFDGFCIVSSDSDFTRLASRIREEGCDAYGFGQKKTPDAFRQACKRFFFTENLGQPVAEAAEAAAVPAGAIPAASDKEPPSAAATPIRKALIELDDDDGWVSLGALGSQIQNMFPDFDTRTYGSAKLSTLLERAGPFEIDRKSQPLRVRVKPRPG